MFLHFFSRRRDEERKTMFRNFIFGVEDSLVSTVGLLSGVAAANSEEKMIVTTGIVLIFVEAFSMGIGSFLSEESAEELAKKSGSRALIGKAASVMFVSYLAAGIIPLAPYIFFGPKIATPVSIGAALAALVLLGIVSARKSGHSLVGKAIEMLILGGLATLVGIGVGSLMGV